MAFKDKLKKVNPKVPPIAMMVVSVIIAGLLALQVVIPKGEDKAAQEEVLSTLQAKVEESRLAAGKKEQFKAEQERLVNELKAAQEKLPTNEEQTKLFENISNTVKESGLKLNNWTKAESKVDPLSLYTETTYSYDADGSFHELGKFMARLDGMTRLLTVSRLDMSSAVLKGYKMDIPIKFTITAYSAAPAAGGK
jgi:Tfp pilus assembly protein PilO